MAVLQCKTIDLDIIAFHRCVTQPSPDAKQLLVLKSMEAHRAGLSKALLDLNHTANV